MAKINFTKEEWAMALGDIAQTRDQIIQTARPHELRDAECSLAKNVIARDELMKKIQAMLGGDKEPTK